MSESGPEGSSQRSMVDNESSLTPSETLGSMVDNVTSATEVDGGQSPKIPKPSDFLGYDHFFSEGNSQTKFLRSMTRPVAISSMPKAANI